MDSVIVQELAKMLSIEEMVNIWYKIRAALAKPSHPLPPYTSIATIVNGRHITTFDGKIFSVDQIDRCSILLAKDFGRTGSWIKLTNGQIESRLAVNSGFEILPERNGVIVITAAPQLYGNVAGAMGTIVSF